MLKAGEISKGPNGQVEVAELKKAYELLMAEHKNDKEAIKQRYGNKGGRWGRGANAASGLVLALGLTMLETAYVSVKAA